MDAIIATNVLMEQHQIKAMFNLLKANVDRMRTPISALFLTLSPPTASDLDQGVEEEITSFLQEQKRETDLFFHLTSPHQWCFIFSQCKEEEARVIFQRLKTVIMKKNTPTFQPDYIAFSAAIAEMHHRDVEFEELIEMGHEALASSLHKGDWSIEYITSYKERQSETIRISIIEDNAIVRNVLKETIEELPVDHFHFDIRLFQDGYEFLESEWYLSSHFHLILVSDILPRKNGLEVVHHIRSLPNQKRFTVYMMTKRKSDEDMILAYESGVDQYLIRPLNIQLLKAQLKRTLKRLWS